jgi:hypothetical protein
MYVAAFTVRNRCACADGRRSNTFEYQMRSSTWSRTNNRANRTTTEEVDVEVQEVTMVAEEVTEAGVEGVEEGAEAVEQEVLEAPDGIQV